MEEKKSVKKYLDILGRTGAEDKKVPFLYVAHEFDWLRNNLNMAGSDFDSIWKGLDRLPEGTGKTHALHAASLAWEGFSHAQGHFQNVEALIEDGVKKCMAGFKNGNDDALDSPFPLIAVEKELKRMMGCLEDAFISVDVGIGRTEEAEGMRCENGHYQDAVRGGLWEGGAGEQGLLDVLWPMRSLEKVVGQAYDAAHETASRVDSLRPKAHSTVKKSLLSPGYFWQMEKERRDKAETEMTPGDGTGLHLFIPKEEKETVRVAEADRREPEGFVAEGDFHMSEKQAGERKKAPNAGKGKPSLKKRLLLAEAEAGRRRKAVPAKGKEQKTTENRICR